jgi:hypothetical protein
MSFVCVQIFNLWWIGWLQWTGMIKNMVMEVVGFTFFFELCVCVWLCFENVFFQIIFTKMENGKKRGAKCGVVPWYR